MMFNGNTDVDVFVCKNPCVYDIDSAKVHITYAYCTWLFYVRMNICMALGQLRNLFVVCTELYTDVCIYILYIC